MITITFFDNHGNHELEHLNIPDDCIIDVNIDSSFTMKITGETFKMTYPLECVDKFLIIRSA